MMHVLPINDEREHEETTACWCEPCVEWNDPETGETYSEGLVIHNAADCRELIEQAEQLSGRAAAEGSGDAPSATEAKENS